MVLEPGGSRWMPAERTWGEFADAATLTGVGLLKGETARANLYVQTFECAGSRPCLMLGDATAGTVRVVGKGRAWLLGTFIGHSGTAYREPAAQGFARALLGRCGIGPAHDGKLLLRKRVSPSGNKQAWLFTNPTGSALTESVDVSGWSRVDDLLAGRLTRQGDRVDLSVDSLDVRVLIVRR
jgi:hypothetical protein